MSEHKILSRQACLFLVLVIFLNTAYTLNRFSEVSADSARPAFHQHKVNHDIQYNYLGRTADIISECQQKMAPKVCYGPEQIRNAYNIKSLPGQNITGKGRTIVISSAFQSPQLRHDLATFDTLFNLPSTPLTIVAPQGVPDWDPNNKTQAIWSAETALDVEWAHVIAPDAGIVVVEGKSDNDNDMVAALQYAVDKNLGDVISMSFGEGENCPKPAWSQAWHAVLSAATQKNMTLIAASGDSGAAQTSCDDKSWQKMVSTPASDPLVTSVGGTTLNADPVTGAYHSETAWNDATTQSASGGGFSSAILRPSYQVEAALPDAGRGVPDVAYNSSMDHGVLCIWSDGPGGSNGVYLFGGTSAGAPQWAAIAILADQAANKRLGSINPLIYKIGKNPLLYQFAFHDIVSGNNTVNLSATSKSPQTVQGYEARPGWDAATGWGSPNAGILVPLLAKLANAK
ncbi:hypothetical protein KDW_22920 [Dictyobacter vulcani]|uniref:Peptidase S53 domain-containing protein n=1 Tax=Dictyobacter vulcani TaxID=2607529 RepID=A0A5J4KNZ7_9CHLR|nr:S53 family peptidase [Dictyobacter vulcani]GER88130.1 hypothetical protein KDW_22920 [Dictyobacter vulcani]